MPKKTPPKELSPEAKGLLVQFANGFRFDAWIDAPNRVIATKQFHRIAQEPEFERALPNLEQTAGDPQAGRERLLAVARLGLTAAIVKPLRGKIEAAFRAALADPLPPLATLNSADSRSSSLELTIPRCHRKLTRDDRHGENTRRTDSRT